MFNTIAAAVAKWRAATLGPSGATKALPSSYRGSCTDYGTPARKVSNLTTSEDFRSADLGTRTGIGGQGAPQFYGAPSPARVDTGCRPVADPINPASTGTSDDD
jgi:hypothetical protein